MNELWQRILTAIILIPLVIAGILFTSSAVFAFISALLFMLAIWEWSNLMIPNQTVWRLIFLGIYLLISIVSYIFLLPDRHPYLLNLLCIIISIWWIGSILLIINYGNSKTWLLNHRHLDLFIGLVILLTCWLALNYLRLRYNLFYLVLLFALIWGADSCAYFVGKYFGKKKLAPMVSPKKTYAGVYGALISALILGILGGFWMYLPLAKAIFLVMLSLFTVLISIVGDLFMSVMKRRRSVKDSGGLFPGHGGALDRLDSLIAGTPIFVLGLILLGFQ